MSRNVIGTPIIPLHLSSDDNSSIRNSSVCLSVCLSVKVDNGIYSVSIDVKNVGKFAGKEVVQLYVSAPNRFQMNKPEKELKAFTKTKELRPGETVTATLKLNTTDLASYDEASSSWVVDAGNYKFLIGTSSKDIKAVLDVDVVSVVEKVIDIDDSVTVSIENPKAELIYTKSNNSRERDFKVYPYSQLNNNLLPNYMCYYEKYKGIVSSRYQDLVWGVTGGKIIWILYRIFLSLLL